MLQHNLSVGPLAPGVSVTLAHHITDSKGNMGRALVPRRVMPNKATAIAVVGTPTTTQVTFQNQGFTTDSVIFECISPHSIQQGLTDTTSCYWRGISSLSGLPTPLGVDGALLQEHPVGTIGWDLLDDGYVVGGFRVVATLNARNAIPVVWRKEGMLVYVVATATAYQLEADLTTWAGYNLTGGTASNVMLAPDPTGAPVTHTVYARPGGSDTTGDGTLGNPYATFTRALRDVPLVIRNAIYIVDITGVTEALPDGWTMPPFSGSVGGLLDFAPVFPGLIFYGSLVIRAIPQVVLAVPAANIISQLPNATTGLITVHTNLALTAHALKGKLIAGGPFELAVVVDNTTTDIETTHASSFDAGDLVIATQTGILENISVTSVGPTVSIPAISCAFSMMGVAVTKTDHGAYSSAALLVGATGVDTFSGMAACDIDGIETRQPSYGMTYYACHVTRLMSLGHALGVFFSLFFDAVLQLSSFTPNGGGGSYFSWCACVGGDTIGIAVAGMNMQVNSIVGNGWIELASCEIRGNSGPGVSLYGADRCAIKDCNIHNNGGSGVLVDSTKYLKMINVDGTANTGYGLEIKNGSTVSADATSSVTGTTNDIKVGGHAAETWAAWASGNQTDLADAGTQMCRLGTT